LILKEKARQFSEDQEVQSLLAEIRGEEIITNLSAEQIKNQKFDRTELTNKRLPYERLDQLTIDILLGVR
jgi:xylose isomerase